MVEIHRVAFDGEPDLVHVRRVVRRLAQLLEFDQRDEVKITAAVSELTRAAGGGAQIAFSLHDDPFAPRLVIEVAGPGLAPAMRKRGSSAAESVIAAEKLLERVADTTPANALRFAKRLPERARALSRSRLGAIRAEL